MFADSKLRLKIAINLITQRKAFGTKARCMKKKIEEEFINHRLCLSLNNNKISKTSARGFPTSDTSNVKLSIAFRA